MSTVLTVNAGFVVGVAVGFGVDVEVVQIWAGVVGHPSERLIQVEIVVMALLSQKQMPSLTSSSRNPSV